MVIDLVVLAEKDGLDTLLQVTQISSRRGL
jgi:hypothetical protein